jgi:ribosomal protein S21
MKNNNNMRDNRKPKEKEFGLSVEVRNGNVEQALRKLKKKMMNDGLLQTLRDRQHFISNTEKRLKAQSASKARHRRREAQDSIVKKRMY